LYCCFHQQHITLQNTVVQYCSVLFCTPTLKAGRCAVRLSSMLLPSVVVWTSLSIIREAFVLGLLGTIFALLPSRRSTHHRQGGRIIEHSSTLRSVIAMRKRFRSFDSSHPSPPAVRQSTVQYYTVQ
jgi:hypothetical protein